MLLAFFIGVAESEAERGYYRTAWAPPLTYRNYGHSPYYGSRTWISGAPSYAYARASHGYYSNGHGLY